MQDSKERTGRELAPIPQESIIPLGEADLGALERHVGLTMEFWNQAVRFNAIMTPKRAGEMSGIGRVDYFIQPGRHPVVKREVYSDTSLYLKISVIPGCEPGTGTVQLRFDSVGIRDVPYYGIDEIPDVLLSRYEYAGPLVEFEELQEFIRRAFPRRKCEIHGLASYKRLPTYYRHFLRVRRETWEKFYWRTSLGRTKAGRSLRRIPPYNMWGLRLEGQKTPLLVFSSKFARVALEQTERGFEFESRILCALPHIFFQGNASEAEHVLESLNNLLQNSWGANTPQYKRRPTTVWQRYSDGKEPFPE